MKRKRPLTIMPILRNILCTFLIFLVIIVYKTKKIQYDRIKSQLYATAVKFMEFEEQSYKNTLQIDTLKRAIAKYNNDEQVLNLDIYGPISPDAPVFVIFVDKYKPNLKFLVTSLQHVIGITDALIIFSHSCFDENVDSLIKTIDFARVVQIYYPYSLQTHPKEYPGYELDSINGSKDTANSNKSTESPQRDPVLAQGKLFWWWTMNHIFKKLSHTKNHKGMIILLDDDMFLMQDFIYMAVQMKQISKFIFPCDIVALHTSGDPDFHETKTYGANLKSWNPKQHASALAFDSRVWNVIESHYSLFCDFDDHSWARSLFYLSLNRRYGNRFKVISSTVPRAIKTGRPSDTVSSLSEYTIVNTVYKVLDMQKRNHGNFYPTQLEIFVDIEFDYDNSLSHVGSSSHWSDPRDKALCIKMTRQHIKKTYDMKSSISDHKNEADDTYGKYTN